jgi:hypothetical protein
LAVRGAFSFFIFSLVEPDGAVASNLVGIELGVLKLSGRNFLMIVLEGGQASKEG